MTRSMRLAELLPDVGALPADLRISGLAMDSRELSPGDAFVAIDGFGVHGLNFVDEARAAGASVILFEAPVPDGLPVPEDAIAVPGLRARLGEIADQFHGRASAAMDVVGVTGTNGKTSTVQLLAQAWSLLGINSATIGTLGAGLYGKPVPTGFTTPLVLRLHALIAELRDAGAEALAMEVSSHALHQGRAEGVHFDVGVFTNLSRDHLDYHGDMASYGAAKARLFGWPGLKAGVINIDDAFGRDLLSSVAPGLSVIACSSHGNPCASVQATDLRLDARGLLFDLQIDGESHPVISPMLGRFNVDNLLSVAGVLSALGETPVRIAQTLSRLQPIHGRMNRLGGDGVLPLVVVDYAHTPDALEQALRSLRGHLQGRLVCVFGCGGERDSGKRPEMAAIAERHADVVFVTDDNPRREAGDAIVADIVAGFSNPEKVRIERDRRVAIDRAIAEAGRSDIVLIAGKGHEPYQEIDGVQHPFDDTDVARQVLGARA